MKRILINICMGTVVLSLLLTTGCTKILKETPRSSFTPQYFQTANGVMGGLTALYAHLRNIYGNAYYWNMCQCGTDETTWGQSGGSGSNFQAQDYSVPGVHPTPTLSDAGQLWGNTFPYINTASGVIQYASAAGVSTSFIAEAKFFRALDYFLLVQTFGGVPLDLGSGRLQFNTSTIRSSKRDSVSIVYTKAIFPDLNDAVNNLSGTPRVTGAVTKQVAQLFLAKAYLTYAWWLQNPNNIPSYPVEAGAPRTDPDGHDPAWYFQKAYDIAVNAIQNPGVYSLQPTFYDVNVATNDYNKECMLYSDHTQLNAQYNVSSFTYGGGGTPDNWSSWFQTWSYPTITSSSTSGSWKSVNSVQRASEQWGGRPWVRNAPPIEVFTQTFADKTNDSRYDGTFTTVYRCNMKEANLPYTTLFNANNLPIAEGDAVLTFLNADSAGVDYSNSTYKSSIGAGVLPGRADYVIGPSAINRIVYPGIWKLGPYRTDNNGGLGNPNAGSTRPYIAAKFSELYFIAAEAAVKGATTQAGYDALSLINVIRARAGKWKYSNAGRTAFVADHSADMVAATPATITVGYILAERSREYYGEGYRFYDLVRTQRFGMDNQEGYNYATYTIGGAAYANHTPIVNTRTITPQLYLQPIPQGQIDAMQMSPADKLAYQNPGYY
ncbi:MAG: RagB/SusD family nutrient uptake outer membrane protein [Sphingobacteriales bacterium 50-39]|nr:RagB/SusD family nutrient uptake outer membrane protein [Sphingobacteriales bacterium]OJW55961.1 MAG: RagB/SusD family nutrient uptake outer membrane protein [Sphingobacteriales bacterium 50-39]